MRLCRDKGGVATRNAIPKSGSIRGQNRLSLVEIETVSVHPASKRGFYLLS